MGKLDRALSAAKEAARLDPVSGAAEMTLSRVYFARREYKKSLKRIRTAGALYGGRPWFVPYFKAWNHFYLGRPERALRLASKMGGSSALRLHTIY